MARGSVEWARVRPLEADGKHSFARRSLVAASCLFAVVLVAYGQLGGQHVELEISANVVEMNAGILSGSTQQAIHAMNKASKHAESELMTHCGSCMSHILSEHKPWEKRAYIDAESAMGCVSGQCFRATKHAMLRGGKDLVAALGANGNRKTEILAGGVLASHSALGAGSESTEQIQYDARQLDQEQLKLNWDRARTFAQYFGKPNPKKEELVWTEWAAPVDPVGRPVPSWLTFQPATPGSGPDLSKASSRLQQRPQISSSTSGMESLASDTKLSAPPTPEPASTCLVHESCGACVGGNCTWCGRAGICGKGCMVANDIQFTSLHECRLSDHAISAAAVKKHSAKETGTAKKASKQVQQQDPWAAEDQRQARDHQELKNLVQLSKMTAGNTLVVDSAAYDFKLRAEDIHPIGNPTGPSLAKALQPLNARQTAINKRRQMLYFRMETGIHPGEDPGEFDNAVKPMTTWSLIGRPMPGWLHWGNDNDGGYFNPTGGATWDPMVVNPAKGGSYGPAVNHWKATHTSPDDMPEEEVKEELKRPAGTPLFGTR